MKNRSATALSWILLPLAIAQIDAILVTGQLSAAGPWNQEARELPSVVFMEPADDTGEGELPTFRRITDASRLKLLKSHLANESAGFAFSLFALAQSIADTDYPYYIAIVEGGNHASQGFQLRTADGQTQRLELAPYIKLDEEAESFKTTLLHETGHMIFSVLSDGKGIPTQPIAPMFHTTSAITDRGTAFNEGFAEHLEAIMAHLTSDRKLRDYYQHRRLTDDNGSTVQSGFLFPINDLSNYAQNFARYQSVRDNQYSFENACHVADYYRIQLSPVPDLDRLRNASQLVASEGFCATYFFWLASEQLVTFSSQQIEATYRPIFETLRRVLLNSHQEALAEVPSYLTEFVKQHSPENPKSRRRAVQLLYHLSHGSFFDRDYRERWTDAVAISYRLDIAKIRALHDTIAKSANLAVDECRTNVDQIDRLVGKVVPVVVPSVQIRLPVAFGARELPLSFDLNSVQSRVLALIPEISSEEVDQFVKSRDGRPFENLDDFKNRSILRADVLRQIEELDLNQ